MNRRLGKFVVIFFIACFLAIQFNAVGDDQLEQSAKQIFHIEDVSLSVIDKPIDNKFIYVGVFQSKLPYLSQQKSKLTLQRQYLEAFERRADHAFLQYMQECLSAICLDYQDKLFTTFNYLQKLELTFEFNSILILKFKQVHSDESDLQFSLS